MPEILTLLSCLTFELNNASLKHLSCIIQAMKRDEWSGNHVGISRWTGKGGSYRTIQMQTDLRITDAPTLVTLIIFSEHFSGGQ